MAGNMITTDDLELFIHCFSDFGIITDWDDVTNFGMLMSLSGQEIDSIKVSRKEKLTSAVEAIMLKAFKGKTSIPEIFDQVYKVVKKLNAKGAYNNFLQSFGLTVNGEKCLKNNDIKQQYIDCQNATVKLAELLPTGILDSQIFSEKSSEKNDLENCTPYLTNFLLKKLKQYGVLEFPNYLAKTMDDTDQLINFERHVKENPDLEILHPEGFQNIN